MWPIIEGKIVEERDHVKTTAFKKIQKWTILTNFKIENQQK